MDDFDIEDIGFDGQGYGGFDFSNAPNIDISGVGSTFDLEDVPFNFDFSGFDLEDTPFNFSDVFGDQPGDYPLYGSYGDPLAPGVQDAVADLLARNVLNDPFSTYDSPEDYSYEGSYGDPLAPGVKEAVEALFQENANVAAGNFPGTSGAPGLTTPKVDQNKTNKVQDAIRNLVGGKDNAALLAALLGGLLGLTKSQGGGGAGRVTGYQGGQGKPLTATRQALSPTGAPGSGGKRFLTDVTYAAEGGLMDIVSGQPNQNVTFMAAGGIADYMKMGKGLSVGDLRKADYLVKNGMSPEDAAKYFSQVEEGMAKGGISDLGSYSDGGRMLKGPGDGMSDDIPASISGKRPARLADGEFVVPADVVSHLGNGSTDAGADVLYGMMDKVRKARTGKKEQGKQINPSKFVPR